MKAITTILALLILLSGCSSDSAFEGISEDSGRKATIEAAAIALDDQDYASAISLLVSLYDTTNPDPHVSRLLGSAYMGMVGIDTTGLIFFAGEEEPNAFDMVSDTLYLNLAPETSSSFSSDDDETCNAEDRTVLILVDEDYEDYNDYKDAEFIDGHCITDVLDYLNEAKYIFNILKRNSRNTYDDDIQLGIASAVHFALKVGNAVADALNTKLDYAPDNDLYDPGIVPVPINRQAYRYYKNYTRNEYNWVRVTIDDFTEEPDASTFLTSYQEDLINLYNAIDSFNRATSEPNDVKDALEDFLNYALLMTTTGIDKNTIISMTTTAGILDLVNNLSSN